MILSASLELCGLSSLHAHITNQECISMTLLFDLKPWSHCSDNQSPTSDNHFFWVVAGGCQRSANVCRWSPTSRRLVVRELHRQPLADLRQPLFGGVVFGGFRWSANDCRWSPTSRRLVVRTVWPARGIRCSIENQTSRRHFCKHSLVGDRSPINRRSVADQSSVAAHHFFWLVTIRRLQNGMRLPLDWA